MEWNHAKLKLLEGDSIVDLNAFPFTIGRALTNRLVIEDRAISRDHCVIDKCDGRYVFRDKSTNGTLINGDMYKKEETKTLEHGDIITFNPEGHVYKFLTKEDQPLVNIEEISKPSRLQEVKTQERILASPAVSDNSISDEMLCLLADNILNEVDPPQQIETKPTLDPTVPSDVGDSQSLPTNNLKTSPTTTELLPAAGVAEVANDPPRPFCADLEPQSPPAQAAPVQPNVSHIEDEHRYASPLPDSSKVEPSSLTAEDSSSNIEVSSSNVQASSSNVQASSSNVPANTSNVAASSSNVPANSSNVPANSSNVAASSSTIHVSSSNVQASSSNVQANNSEGGHSVQSPANACKKVKVGNGENMSYSYWSEPSEGERALMAMVGQPLDMGGNWQTVGRPPRCETPFVPSQSFSYRSPAGGPQGGIPLGPTANAASTGVVPSNGAEHVRYPPLPPAYTNLSHLLAPPANVPGPSPGARGSSTLQHRQNEMQRAVASANPIMYRLTAKPRDICSTDTRSEPGATSNSSNVPGGSLNMPIVPRGGTDVPGRMVNVIILEGVSAGSLKVPKVRDGSSNVPTVQGGSSNVLTVQDGSSNVPTVQGGSSNVPTVRGGSSNVLTVQGGSSNVPMMQGGTSNVPTVRGGSSNVPMTQGGSLTVPTVQGGSLNVQTVQGGSSNVPAVRDGSSNVPLSGTEAQSSQETVIYSVDEDLAPTTKKGKEKEEKAKEAVGQEKVPEKKEKEAEEAVGQEKVPEKKDDANQYEEMENELQCAICSELFIKATTLGCSHTFCRHCIDMWRRNKADCPICRRRIAGTTHTLVLDNVIRMMVDGSSAEVRAQRRAVEEQRDRLEREAAAEAPGREAPGRGAAAQRRGGRRRRRRGRAAWDDAPESGAAAGASAMAAASRAEAAATAAVSRAEAAATAAASRAEVAATSAASRAEATLTAAATRAAAATRRHAQQVVAEAAARRRPAPAVIEVPDDTDSSTQSSSTSEDTYEDWRVAYDDDDSWSDSDAGLPGAYFGGYGSCYSCGSRGHWSNGCPYR